MDEQNNKESGLEHAIAIVGMAGRFPDAKDVRTLWQNIMAGHNAVGDLSDEEMDGAGTPEDIRKAANFVAKAATLAEHDCFDADYFDINKRDAQLKDPQHKALLEGVDSALQDAGYVPDRFDGLIGLYAGIGSSGYLVSNLVPNTDLVNAVGMHSLYMHTEKDFAPTFVSYKLNLKGPSININCGCSSSLVAVHTACKALLAFECDMALAGAASIAANQKTGYLYQEGYIMARGGKCCPFDADASGTLPGHGVGIVALKRYDEAVADGDHIYAAILGSAINNDGADKVGYSAPSAEGQAAVIGEALAMADIEPDTIDFIETHGTGTRLGDPIEIKALKKQYGGEGDKCFLGAVKANLGHLNAASGVTGLIKAAMVVKTGDVPPLLHFKKLNPEIDLEGCRFTLNAEPALIDRDEDRRAAVSSFGIGGTNAHVILAQAQALDSDDGWPYAVLPVSAKTPEALQQNLLNLADHLERDDGQSNLSDVAFTLQQGRACYDHRRMVVAKDTASAVTALKKVAKDWVTEKALVLNRVVFAFPGQGAQHVGMMAGLYQNNEVFKAQLDTCADIIQSHSDLDLIELLYGESASNEAANQRLAQTNITQPVLFSVSYALAKVYQDWGLEPDAMIGHSLGEYVAACIAGVFTLEDALKLVIARGKVMHESATGQMVSVRMDNSSIKALLPQECIICCENGPDNYVVGGPAAEVQAFIDKLPEGTVNKVINHSNAFHTELMSQAARDYAAAFDGVTLNPPHIAFASNVTGKLISDEQATSMDYWLSHILCPVKFQDGLDAVMNDNTVMVEVGPNRTLSGLATACGVPAMRVVTTMPHVKENKDAEQCAYEALGKLWLGGYDVDWSAFYQQQQRRRVSLPVYAYQRKRYWIDPPEVKVISSKMVSDDEVIDEAEVETPQSKTLGLVERLLCERLGHSNINASDNFFDLGGDSLVATQLVARIKDETGLEISFNAFLSAETVGDITDKLNELKSGESEMALEELSLEEKRQGVELSFAQNRLWFMEQLHGKSSLHNISAAVRLTGQLNTQWLHEAFQAIVDRHDTLRTRFVEIDKQPMQIVEQKREVDFRIRQRQEAEPGIEDQYWKGELAKLIDTAFDIQGGALMTVQLVSFDQDNYLLLLVIHHIISDGWSMGNIIREVNLGYRARVENKSSGLEPLKMQYTAFARLQNSASYLAMIDEQLAYWHEQLKGGDHRMTPSPLPSRPETLSHDGASIEHILTMAQAGRLKDKAAHLRVSEFMLIQLAFLLFLYRETGKTDLQVGTDVANRRQSQMESVIGFFVNQLVLRNKLDPAAGFVDAVKAINNTALDAYANQDAPFEKVVAGLNMPRESNYSPLFQTKLVYQNTPAEALALEGVKVDAYAIAKQVAEQDLICIVWITPDQFGFRFEYNTALFAPAQIKLQQQKFARILALLCDEDFTTVAHVLERVDALEAEQSKGKSKSKKSRLGKARRSAVDLG